jgi:surfactin synthase thioesterase subunit
MRYLRSIGGFASDIDSDVLAFVMRVFRHDVAEGGRYFAENWSPGTDTPPLATPITFIAGTDDPLTLLWDRQAKLWLRFSRSVDLAAVPGGKHYFVQHQPGTLAMIIERVLTGGITC